MSFCFDGTFFWDRPSGKQGGKPDLGTINPKSGLDLHPAVGNTGSTKDLPTLCNGGFKSNKKITKSDIDDFYLRCNSKLNRILTTALSNLSKKKLIDFEERTVICKSGIGRIKYELASPDERKKLLEIEAEVLDEFKCSSIQEIVFKKKTVPYYKRVINKIKDKYNWEYYYKAYSIVFKHDRISKFIPRLEKSVEEAILGLNGEIINALNNEAESKYARQMKKYNEIIDESARNSAILNKFIYFDLPSEYYITAQKILSDELISISSNDKVKYQEELNPMIDKIDFDHNELTEDELLLFEK